MSDLATKLNSPDEAVARVPGIVLGVVVGEGEDGRPLVSWAGRHWSRAATVVWMDSPPKWSACKGLRVVLAFAEGDEEKPLLLGLLDAPRLLDTVDVATNNDEHTVKSIKPNVLRIESQEELILECGKAKISLREDGRVLILGGYVLSRSRGVNKIKGGSVQVN